MLKGKKIGVIGGGKMGGVIIRSIMLHNLATRKDITVSDRERARMDELREELGVNVTVDNIETVKRADVVILAVKPQNMPEVLEEITAAVDKRKIVISIAAGISIKFIEGRFKKGIHIIRAMPNMPALVGEGVTAVAPGEYATEKDLAAACSIFDSVGMTVVVKEELMNAITGLSGSGPAYGFVVIEALSDAGVRMGLSRDLALKLSAQTMLGAAKLCLSGDRHPAQLKDMVTSPGGTTIAGLKALEEGKIRATLMAAVEAATLRAGELGGVK